MNASLLEELLNEDEGTSLDFKRDRYLFAGADEETKSEILKDILALANAWRRTEAYILIGVDEVKGGKSMVVGVTTHLNDNDLQQFVNSKTQRALTFSYETVAHGGKQIGAIRIPLQQRPFHLKRDFGRLKKDTVYIRRGSSTDIASLDEIAEIGVAWVQDRQSPKVDLEFTDAESDTNLGTEIEITSHIIEFVESQAPWNLVTNSEYVKLMARYVSTTALLTRISFHLTNLSSELAVNVKIVLRVEKMEGLILLHHSNYPAKPKKHFFEQLTSPHVFHQSSCAVGETNDRWLINVNCGSLQPHATYTPSGSFFLGSSTPRTLKLEAFLFGDNIPEPIKVPLIINIITARAVMNTQELTK